MRKIEILITKNINLILVMVILFALAALVGCKDEAEAVEPTTTTITVMDANDPINVTIETVEPNDTKFINGLECKRFGGGWQPIKSFCPGCGEFSPWSDYCSKCGAKNYKGDYRYVCTNGHDTYSSDPYCKTCGAKTTLKNVDPEIDLIGISINDANTVLHWHEQEPNEPNDYDELVVVVQELQKIVGKVIDAGTTQNNCLESLANIDISILERISYLEKSVRPATSFVSIMLGENIEINGEKQGDMTADERLVLVRRAFEMMAKHEREIDPNQLWNRYETNTICIEGIEEPNEPKEKPLNPKLNNNHPLSKGLTGYELFIPTWPDYIELEKDLIVDISNRVRQPADKTWTFVKGTKIYFKEDK